MDQLERSHGLAPERIVAVRQALAKAEQAAGAGRQTALTALAAGLEGDAKGSGDAAKVAALARTVRDLGGAGGAS